MLNGSLAKAMSEELKRQNARTRNILCIMQLPPPIHGVSYINSIIASSSIIKEEICISAINLSSSKSISDLNSLKLSKFLKIAVLYTKCLFEFIARRPDAIYVSVTPTGNAFFRDALFIILARALSIRRIFHLHGKGISLTRKKSIVLDFIYRQVFKDAYIILLSDRLRYDIDGLVPPDRVAIVHNGVADAGKSHQKNVLNGGRPPRILFFSNLLVSKGIYITLQALSIVKSRGHTFYADFVGDWENESVRNEFNSRVVTGHISDNVIVHGPRYQKEKEEFFKNSDIFVLPTMSDCFPLVLLEAMSFSLPIITTNQGAIEDIVIDGETGFIIPQNAPFILAEHIEYLLLHPNARRRTGENGRQRFLKLFQQEIFEKNMANALKFL